jgi:hypothetical protein
MNFIRPQGSDLDSFFDDNVLGVTDSVQMPLLKVGTSPTNEIVFWPTLYSDGFQLQQNSNLTVTNWTATGTTFQITNGSNQATFSSPPPNRFFRLYHA